MSTNNELSPKEADWPLLAWHPQDHRHRSIVMRHTQMLWGQGEGTVRDLPIVWPSFSSGRSTRLFSNDLQIRKPSGPTIPLKLSGSEVSPPALGSQEIGKSTRCPEAVCELISLLLCSQTVSVCYLQPQTQATGWLLMHLQATRASEGVRNRGSYSPSSNRHPAGIFP